MSYLPFQTEVNFDLTPPVGRFINMFMLVLVHRKMFTLFQKRTKNVNETLIISLTVGSSVPTLKMSF